MITDPIVKYRRYPGEPRAAPASSVSRGFCYVTTTRYSRDQGSTCRSWSFAPAMNSMQGLRLSLTLPGAP